MFGGHAVKKELGIARCGLACCLCSKNKNCNGCHADDCAGASECEVRKCCIEKGFSYCFECGEAEICQKGMLSNLKAHTFTMFAKKYSIDRLTECLETNEKCGIVYHRNGFSGDYDKYLNVNELMKFIEEGKTPCLQEAD